MAAVIAGTHTISSLSTSSSVSQRQYVSVPTVSGLRVVSAGANKNGLIGASRIAFSPLPPRLRKQQLKVEARTSGAVKEIEMEVDKPLGIELGQKDNGPILVTSVAPGSNGAKAGMKVGDQVVYTSSFFGDELWPAEKLGFTRTAMRAKPDSIYFVLARGGEVTTKRLPKRPAPSRFGKKLTEAQKERATHICLDCGYIYTLSKPFSEQPEGYNCPQCSAPKKRFAQYDAETGSVVGGGNLPIVVILTLLLGVVGIGAGVFYGLQ